MVNKVQSTLSILILLSLAIAQNAFAQETIQEPTEIEQTSQEVIEDTTEIPQATETTTTQSTNTSTITQNGNTVQLTVVEDKTEELAETKLKPVVEKLRVDTSWNRKKQASNPDRLFDLTFSGLLRNQFKYILTDGPERHNGFNETHVRLGVDANIKKLFGANFTFDGAIKLKLADGKTQTSAGLTDAYLYTKPFKFLHAKAGRFIPEFDIESIYSTAGRLFADLSLVNRGIKASEGKAVSGMGLGREMGVSLYAPPIYFSSEDNSAEGFGLSYSLALTNGSSANSGSNDNEKYAFYGRLGLHWAKMASLAFAGYYNTITTTKNNVSTDKDKFGLSSDLNIKFAGVDFWAGYTQVTETPVAGNAASVTTRGAQTSLLYNTGFYGITPGVRYAYLDPNTNADSDAVHAISFGASLDYPDGWPFRTVINYTVNLEDGNSIKNDRFDLVLQAQF